MAEVHIIGEIVEGLDFGDRSLFAKWSLNAGSCWQAIEGFTEGQTHLSAKSVLEPRSHPWSHPIDVHYRTKGLQGWPKLEFQAWGVDWIGKCNISAYGFLTVPTKAGHHKLVCHTWLPVGDFRRRLIDSITGHRLHLIDPSDIISNGYNRHVIQTQSMGSIVVDITVILRHFQDYGVDI